MGGGDLISTSDRERSHLVNQSVAFPPDPTAVRKEGQKQKRGKESDHTVISKSCNRAQSSNNVSITASAVSRLHRLYFINNTTILLPMEPAKKFPSVSLDSCANISQGMGDGKCKGMNGGLWVWPGFGRGWAGQGRG